MNDPSDGVPQQLVRLKIQDTDLIAHKLTGTTQLPHVHLVSKYRYPISHRISIETIIEHLIAAPRITRDVAPMHWMFLDAPQDGSMLLVWQPLQKLGNTAASDGYHWIDAEQAFSTEMKGYV